jgi:signal transduction histidine kinase
MDSELTQRLDAGIEALRRCEERALAGQFALEVMHEIRNPLDALGHLVYLSVHATDLNQVHEYMRAANEQIVTLHEIAGQSLKLARRSQTATPVDLVALSEAALRVHHRRLNAKQIQLVRDFPESLMVTVRTGEMLQVLSNLIGNAVDALPQEGTITLRIRKRGEKLYLFVADNGHGIATEHLSQLFQPFFTTKSDVGNGLGLALSKKILERHGGGIRVRSCSDPSRGSGTTFRIHLPA